MKYLFKIVVVSLLGFMFLGCQEQPTPVYNNWPITIDSSLSSQVTVVNSISRRRDDSLLEVQILF